MDSNLPNSSNKLMPEQAERLRTAMKILINYLLENGHLTSNPILANTLTNRSRQNEKLTTTLPQAKES